MKKILIILAVLVLISNVSFAKEFGDFRTFAESRLDKEPLTGKWEIVDILVNKNITAKMLLDTTVCPHCDKQLFRPQWYVFNYMEILKQDDRTLHFGIERRGHNIILERFLDKDSINKIMEAVR